MRRTEKYRDENIGRVIGGYRILEELGAGATAHVYRACQVGTGEICALKYSVYPGLIHREAEILKRIGHTCFPKWMGEGEDGGAAYLVMEYIPGAGLQKLMERYPSGMPERMAAGLGLDVAAGLACLHDCQPAYIYRDLKAANVIITPEGRARLVDLGAAVCPEDTGEEVCPAGTYGYGAPEQFWNGAQITPACDIYGFGKLLSFLLTGQDPGKPPYDTVEYYSRHAGVGRPFKRLLDRCLQQDPQLRYPKASFLIPPLTELTAAGGYWRKKIQAIPGRKRTYRYIKCIWRSEYKRLF